MNWNKQKEGGVSKLQEINKYIIWVASSMELLFIVFVMEFDYKCRKCIFLGYGIDGQFGYLLWDLHICIVVRSRDVVFDEEKMK